MRHLHNDKTTTRPAGTPSRGATTLTEALISLLAMSVAVVSVATLFPLSILRSVEARQLTKATILRHNAENKLEIHPALLNPNRVPVGAGPGQFNNFVPRGRNFVVDPLGWHRLRQFRADANINTAPFPNNIEDRFGNNAGTPFGQVFRTHGGFGDRAAALAAPGADLGAERLVTLPDSWSDPADNPTRAAPAVAAVNPNPAAGGITQVTMPPDIDLFGIPAAGLSRIVLFDTTGRFSRSHLISLIDPNTNLIRWDEDINNNGALDPGEDLNGNGALDFNGIPPGFGVGSSVGEAWIEVKEDRYTWMLTVRSGTRSVDVVVFFRRSFEPSAEQVYRPLPHPTVAGQIDQRSVFRPFEVDADGQLKLDEIGRPIPNRRLLVGGWTPDTKPALKRGGYVFDLRNALWYRIADVQNETSTTAELVFGDFIRSGGNQGAIIPPGVIEVYPISY